MKALKQSLRKAVEEMLAALVRMKLRRTRPRIIGITGSFGKTTTKDAIACVLRARWRVQTASKSLNTEIGLLLAVLEQSSGFSSPIAWLKVLTLALWNAVFGAGADFLVLEYGADKPGDIAHLISRVRPDVAVITHIARVHQDAGQFKSIDEVLTEKRKLAAATAAEGTVLLNGDDPLLRGLAGVFKAKTLMWSVAEKGTAVQENAIRAEQFMVLERGFSAEITVGNTRIRANFPVLGIFHLHAFLPALLAGTLFNIPLAQGLEALQHFKLPPGRLSLLPGKNGSLLIDSSYNASPETMKQALGVLRDFPLPPDGRRIAVLGTMNELGAYAAEGHREAAAAVGPWLTRLIGVGEGGRIIAEACLKLGLPKDTIQTLETAEEAARKVLAEGLRKGDLILFKGSQNRVRLERAVEMLMAEPERAGEFLCRQEKEWTRH